MKIYKCATLVVLMLLTVITVMGQADSLLTTKVNGACGQCKQRIEKALKIPGIIKAGWDVKTQLLTVHYDASKIKAETIHEKIAAAGHDTELKKASQEAYEKLPDCCMFRDPSLAAFSDSAVNNKHFVHGLVLSEDHKGNIAPLAGATVLWLGTKNGARTDVHGVFSIPYIEKAHQLVVSYADLRPDTVDVDNMEEIQVILASAGELHEVRITSKERTTFINNYNPFRIETITSKELLKAACCNLSESFETNPSVDVSYNDAITGSKQIQLLGLSGNYTQLTVENLPGPRGLATPLGLNSIAGPWIENIQLSKGTGSVVNGYESIAGQINIELKKGTEEKVYANGYINSIGKTDFNLNFAQRINNKWSTIFLLHDDFLYANVDDNKDGFKDLPTGNLFSGVNKWIFDNHNGLVLQLGAKALIDDRIGGEIDFVSSEKLTTAHYGVGFNTARFEGFAKIGYVFPGKKFRSIGLQLSAFSHDQDSYFGRTLYNANQDNFYSNLIFQDIVGTTAHKIRTGLSFVNDRYHEVFKTSQYKRTETVPGGFFEYSFVPNEKFSLVAGLRADRHSIFGWFGTPRLNVRFAPVAGTTIRLSAGRGQRTANIFAENVGALVSSREVEIHASGEGKAYGLNPEIAWNKGISIDQRFMLFGRSSMFSLDFYRNDFANQVIVDLEDPRKLKFYNLDGKSYSNSLQAELSLNPMEGFDVKFAYRWFDVKTNYGGKELSRPFNATHRAFANLGYETGLWKLDYIFNFMGEKRLPSTSANPDEHQFHSTSPAYVTMNAQLSRTFGKKKSWELYLGAENFANYFQEETIIAHHEPFGEYFDASMIWGPVSERMFYFGFRFKVK